MQEGLEDLQTDWVTPKHVAEELTAIGFVTGGLLAVHRLLGLTPFKVWLHFRAGHHHAQAAGCVPETLAHAHLANFASHPRIHVRDLHPLAENFGTVAMHLHVQAQRPMQIN